MMAYDPANYAPGFYRPVTRPALIITDKSALQNPKYALANRKWQGCPTIARTPKGTLWAGWYTGGIREPDEENYNLLAFSSDDGRTWREPALVIESIPEEYIRAMDIQLWLAPDMRLWVFWTETRDGCKRDADGRLCSYVDEQFGIWAITTADIDSPEPEWSEPERISDGFLRCRPSVLLDGRIMMCPYDWINDRYAYNVSDNGGKSWTRRFGAIKSENFMFDEAMITERRDGSLWMLARTGAGRLAQTFSFDGGKTWTPVGFSMIKTPSSRFFIDRLPSGRLMLINHVDFDGKRKNMAAFLSDDDGETWPHMLMLDPADNVSYPDVACADDGRIFVVHDRARVGLGEILLSVITEADILNGALVTPGSYVSRVISAAPAK